MNIKQFLAIGATVAGTTALPSFAAQPHLNSLTGVTEKVTAELVVRDTGPLSRELLIAFNDKATG